MNIFHPLYFITTLLFSISVLVSLCWSSCLIFTTWLRLMPYSSTKIHYFCFNKAEILWQTKYNFEALELTCFYVVKCLINKAIHIHLDLGPNRHVYRNNFLLLLLFYCSHESHIFHTNTKTMKGFFFHNKALKTDSPPCWTS